MQSISVANGREAVRKKIKRRLIILCAPRQLGAHKMAKMSPKTGYFRSTLCMWSDHTMIRPHEKYRRRERARIRSEKRKRCFTMLGSHKTCERPSWPIYHQPTVRFGCNLACDRSMIGSDCMPSYSVASGLEAVRKNEKGW
jgi:hypothetical protein